MDTGPGRGGRPRSAEGSRAAILDAAERAFAEHGFDGARVDSIAADSGYNKSLIFQHFGDKGGLYAEVLRRADEEAARMRAGVIAPLLARPGLATDAAALRAFFEEALGAVFDHMHARPRMLRILLWEAAEGWSTAARQSAGAQAEQLDQLDQLFREAQAAGLIRSSFAPAIQLSMALQTIQAFLASAPLFQALVPGMDPASPEARAYIVSAAVAAILSDQPPAEGRSS